MSSRVLTGTFRSWKDAWGFIVCPESFDGDLFAHKRNFVGEPTNEDLTGRKVQFRRGFDPKNGKPHAEDIRVLGGSNQRSQGTSSRGPPRKPPPIPPSMPPPNVLFGFAPVPMPIPVQGGANRANVDKLDKLVGQILRGEIRKWKGEWGFITSAKFDGDIFAHTRSLQFEGEPSAGRQVSFKVATDKRGRMTAEEVTDPVAAADDFADNGEVLIGKIRSWRKDWGFIVAPEHFEGDLFCHHGDLQLEGPDRPLHELDSLVKDRDVEFQVAKDRKNRVCAVQVRFLDPLPEAFESQALDADSTFHEANQYAEDDFQADQYAEDDFQAAGEDSYKPSPIEEELEGTIRKYKEPWGFIVSPENFDGDLFCHVRDFKDRPPAGQDIAGQRVRFKKTTDRKGRENAIEVHIIKGGSSQGIARGSDNRAAARRQTGPIDPKFASLVGQEICGQVRSWKGEWGFITAQDRFEGDLFCHRDHLEEGTETMMPGVYVDFEVGSDSKGRPSALKVQCVTEAKDWMGTGAKMRGRVRSFKKPFGFLVAPGCFKGDLFFGAGELLPPLREEYVQSGLEVNFIVEEDKNGKPCARQISQVGPQAPKRGPAGPPPQQQAFKRPRML